MTDTSRISNNTHLIDGGHKSVRITTSGSSEPYISMRRQVFASNGGAASINLPTGIRNTSKVQIESENAQEKNCIVNGRCSCCPYGYHVDVDFLHYLETLSNDGVFVNNNRRKELEKQMKTKLDTPVRAPLSPQELNNNKTNSSLMMKSNSTSAYDDVIEKRRRKVLDSIDFDSLQDSMKSPGSTNRSPNMSPNFMNSPNVKSRPQIVPLVHHSPTQQSSVHSSSMKIRLQNSPNESEAKMSAVFNDFDITDELSLMAIRNQMALSLQRMKELEEQVKCIPSLQIRINTLNNDKRDLVEKLKDAVETSNRHSNELRVERTAHERTLEMRTVYLAGGRSGAEPAQSPLKVSTRSIGIGDHVIDEPETESSVHLHDKEMRTFVIAGANVAGTSSTTTSTTSTMNHGFNTSDTSKKVSTRNVGISCRALTRDVGVMVEFKQQDSNRIDNAEDIWRTSTEITNQLTTMQQINLAAFQSKHVHIKIEDLKEIISTILHKDIHSVGVQTSGIGVQMRDVGIMHTGFSNKSVAVGDDTVNVQVRPLIAVRSVASEARTILQNRAINTDKILPGITIPTQTMAPVKKISKGTLTNPAIRYAVSTNTVAMPTRNVCSGTEVRFFRSNNSIKDAGTTTPTTITSTICVGTINSSPTTQEQSCNTNVLMNSITNDGHLVDVSGSNKEQYLLNDFESEQQFVDNSGSNRQKHLVNDFSGNYEQNLVAVTGSKSQRNKLNVSGGNKEKNLVNVSGSIRERHQVDISGNNREKNLVNVSGGNNEKHMVNVSGGNRKQYSSDVSGGNLEQYSSDVSGGNREQHLVNVSGCNREQYSSDVSGGNREQHLVNVSGGNRKQYSSDVSGGNRDVTIEKRTQSIDTSGFKSTIPVSRNIIIQHSSSKNYSSGGGSGTSTVTTNSSIPVKADIALSTFELCASSTFDNGDTSSNATDDTVIDMRHSSDSESTYSTPTAFSTSGHPKSIMKHTTSFKSSSSSSSGGGATHLTKKEISFSDDVLNKRKDSDNSSSSSSSSDEGESYDEASYDGRIGSIRYRTASKELESPQEINNFLSEEDEGHLIKGEVVEEQEIVENNEQRVIVDETDTNADENIESSLECLVDEIGANEIEILSKETEKSCRIYSTWLRDSTTINTKQLNTSKFSLQNIWFEISSHKKSNYRMVRRYMNAFAEFSNDLLSFVINMPDANGNTSLHYAVSHGNMAVVEILISRGAPGEPLCSVNARNRAGYTSIMLAALVHIDCEDQASVFKNLFDKGDIDARATQAGQTALMLATSHGRTEMVKLLMHAGAEINLRDDDGSTALMCASEHGHSEIVKILLAHPDIDPSLTDNDNSTAMSIAMEAGHRDIGVLLYAHVNFKSGSPGFISKRTKTQKKQIIRKK